MKAFKYIILITLPFLLFIVLIRTSIGSGGYFGTFDFLQLFNDFPESEYFIEQLTLIAESLNDLFNFTDIIQLIPSVENDVIGINYVITALNTILSTIYDLFNMIYNLFVLLVHFCAYLGQILSWLLGCFGKILL